MLVGIVIATPASQLRRRPDCLCDDYNFTIKLWLDSHTPLHLIQNLSKKLEVLHKRRPLSVSAYWMSKFGDFIFYLFEKIIGGAAEGGITLTEALYVLTQSGQQGVSGRTSLSCIIILSLYLIFYLTFRRIKKKWLDQNLSWAL